MKAVNDLYMNVKRIFRKKKLDDDECDDSLLSIAVPFWPRINEIRRLSTNKKKTSLSYC